MLIMLLLKTQFLMVIKFIEQSFVLIDQKFKRDEDAVIKVTICSSFFMLSRGVSFVCNIAVRIVISKISFTIN